MKRTKLNYIYIIYIKNIEFYILVIFLAVQGGCHCSVHVGESKFLFFVCAQIACKKLTVDDFTATHCICICSQQPFD